MSEVLWDDSGLVISTYAGPAQADGVSRKRVQIAGWDHDTQTRTWTTLGMGAWRSLCRAVEALGPDCSVK